MHLGSSTSTRRLCTKETNYAFAITSDDSCTPSTNSDESNGISVSSKRKGTRCWTSERYEGITYSSIIPTFAHPLPLSAALGHARDAVGDASRSGPLHLADRHAHPEDHGAAADAVDAVAADGCLLLTAAAVGSVAPRRPAQPASAELERQHPAHLRRRQPSPPSQQQRLAQQRLHDIGSEALQPVSGKALSLV